MFYEYEIMETQIRRKKLVIKSLS